MKKFQKLQEDREAALQALKNIWRKMKAADARKVQEAIEKAIRAAESLP
jgi:hypothetical protein